MADEVQTAETNSENPATPTDASGVTDTPTSNTDQTSGDQPSEAADDLDSGGLLDGASGEDAGAGDGEGADEGAGDGEGDVAEEGLTGAPEGDYELTLGEDADFTIAPETLAEFAPLAKELNLSNKGLTEVVSKGVPLVQDAVMKAMVNDVIATRKAWEGDSRALVQGGKLADGTEVQASPVFQGENMDAVLATAGKALDRFTRDEAGQPRIYPGAKPDGSPGTFGEFLKTTGLGNHPGMVQTMFLVGKAISEDSDFERGGDVAPTKLSREEKYYPQKQT